MRILVVEDDTNLNRQIKDAFTEADYAVERPFVANVFLLTKFDKLVTIQQ